MIASWMYRVSAVFLRDVEHGWDAASHVVQGPDRDAGQFGDHADGVFCNVRHCAAARRVRVKR
jgi:hypothetical protein